METFAELKGDEDQSTSRSGWILTYTGRQFFLHDPKPEDVCIEDIAHALSMLCRFTGHCSRFYSVAEHSLLVTQNVQKKFRPWALLHDAAEAYVNDLARPLKRSPDLAYYRAIEDEILGTILDRFGLHPGIGLWMPKEVKVADLRALATERRDLMIQAGPEWELGVDPFPELIQSVDAFRIEKSFLALAAEYGLA